jgi:putative ABC transport system permease protein
MSERSAAATDVGYAARAGLIGRLALRDLRSGLRGFGIFLACLALGVGSITGVGSVTRALTDALAREGARILGGDVALSTIHRELNEAEVSWLAAHGQVSGIETLRAMARRPDDSAALVEIKAVQPSYPSRGEVLLEPAVGLEAALGLVGDRYGIAADPALLARLDLHVGDQLTLANLPVELRAVLVSEPDKLAAGVGFGPRVLISEAALRASGLVQPGSLIRWTSRITLAGAGGEPVEDAAIARFVAAANAAFPEAGWEVRTRSNVSPNFSRNIERFSQFLTLVGLTALIVGGVGIANAVRLYVDRQRPTLATMKALGASGTLVFLIALCQVMAMALLGIAIGLVIGLALPILIVALFGHLSPVPLNPTLYPRELALGVLYGLLTTLVFTLGPLGRVHDTAVSALFRDRIAPQARWPRRRYLVLQAVTALMLAASAILLSADRYLSLIYSGVAIGAFVLLRLVGQGLMALARRLPHARWTELRLAIGNIHRPGALTPSVVLSLGLGLALLVALILIEHNIRAQLNQALPGRTPSFFFIDIPDSQIRDFDNFLEAHAPPGAKVEHVPMMRGRIIKLKDQKSESIKAPENASWVLEGDRGITYAARLPEGSTLAAGTWWPEDYSGPPLVSIDKDIAQGLGLAIGDLLTVNVFGRNIVARIANLRVVDWRTLGINFVLVFSPNTFAGAPHAHLATITFADQGDGERDSHLVRDVAKAYPAVTSVRVKDALDSVNTLVAELAFAIRAASGVALTASVLVLAGALAAQQSARLYDAVVLKTLGATRRRLLVAFVLEYALLGMATAMFGLLAGTLAAWYIIAKVMKFGFVVAWSPALAAALGALLVTVILGLIGTWRILGLKPGPYLRDL